MSLIARQRSGRANRQMPSPEQCDQDGPSWSAPPPPAASENGSAQLVPPEATSGANGESASGSLARPESGARRAIHLDVDIAPNDPLIGYFQEGPGAVEIAALALDSPALDAMRAAGVVIAVPLVVSGELIGMVLLGPRLSERGYSGEDRRLLDSLASYAAPALRMGQLAEQQKAEALRRERIDQELVVAQLIQQQFLPKALPDLPGWNLTAFYRPARTVGGDFYDCIELSDGRAMIVVGDVTDKGVPAALVMASTHSLLRAEAPRLGSPGATLAQVNDMLCGDIPAHMFVTCIALVLDPKTGRIDYANAGHDLPYLRTAGRVLELRATGMPLGLMPGMRYEEETATLHPGDHVLLHSDGLAEAHNDHREMFGFPRVADLAGRPASGQQLIDMCLSELERFSGAHHEQEDDITLVTLEYSSRSAASWTARPVGRALLDGGATMEQSEQFEELARFEVPSEPGNERMAMERVRAVMAPVGLPEEQLERLLTAVAEATMNAIEHGNADRPEVPVEVAVLCRGGETVVTITDMGAGCMELAAREAPDLEAKLSGAQRPRGWGLFLIENMVDGVDDIVEGDRHTLRLVVRQAPSQLTGPDECGETLKETGRTERGHRDGEGGAGDGRQR
jgi:serine phosphatase RsbU (regulator of sigma subunit)/anti-sigma regulatory factor (Ser/Thr protein kinase)